MICVKCKQDKSINELVQLSGGFYECYNQSCVATLRRAILEKETKLREENKYKESAGKFNELKDSTTLIPVHIGKEKCFYNKDLQMLGHLQGSEVVLMKDWEENLKFCKRQVENAHNEYPYILAKYWGPPCRECCGFYNEFVPVSYYKTEHEAVSNCPEDENYTVFKDDIHIQNAVVVREWFKDELEDNFQL